jgi:cobalt/nickel transport system permease protein
MRMQMARDSRNFGMNHRNIFRTMGNMIGMLFVRSYERAERIYAAMLSRGYSGLFCPDVSLAAGLSGYSMVVISR